MDFSLYEVFRNGSRQQGEVRAMSSAEVRDACRIMAFIRASAEGGIVLQTKHGGFIQIGGLLGVDERLNGWCGCGEHLV